MATEQPQQQPDSQIDVTAAEWLMIIVTGFAGVFAGPFALVPGAVLIGMFTYRVNPELMKASAAGKWVRGFLPAPIPEQDASAQPNSPKADAATITAQPGARATAAKGKGAIVRELTMIDLAALAKCSTILLVGSRGSGKSTLLRALLQARKQFATVAVYDPHAAPDDWPMATLVHNSEASISAGMASAYKRLQARKNERRQGIRTEGWTKITLAADEWGAIVAGVKLPEAIGLTPGEVSTALMKEGRKFQIGFVAGAHGFTNKSLGCVGDNEAFLNSFDWIIQLGSFTRKLLEKQYADLWAEMPMGTNEEGGTFPLIVACVSPSTGEMRLLDMRGLDKTVDTRSQQKAPALPWQQVQSSPDQALLSEMLARAGGDTEYVADDIGESHGDRSATASQSDVTSGDMATVAAPTATEIAHIAMSLSQGKSVRQVARGLKGYNGRTHKACTAKVEYVKALINTQPASDAPQANADDDEEPPEWFGKAFH